MMYPTKYIITPNIRIEVNTVKWLLTWSEIAFLLQQAERTMGPRLLMDHEFRTERPSTLDTRSE